MTFGEAYINWLGDRKGTTELLDQFRKIYVDDEKFLRDLPPYSKVRIFGSSNAKLNGLEATKVSDGKGRMLVSCKLGMWRVHYGNLKSDALELLKKL